jgi:uncharacterized membrane protein (DUF485 family)
MTEGRTPTCGPGGDAVEQNSQGPASRTDTVDYLAVEESPKFKELKRRHRSFVLPVAALFLIWYFVYVLLADYAHDFMATPVFGNVNVGLLFGLGQFVTTFGITMWYVWYANRKLDPLADELRTELASTGTTSDAEAGR